MAKKKRKKTTTAKRRSSNPSKRRKGSSKRRGPARRRNPSSGGMARAALAVGAGLVSAAAIYAVLSLPSVSASVSGNTAALVGGGAALALGAAVGMMGAPDIGVGIAAGGGGAAAAQLAVYEVAQYEAGTASQPTVTPAPTHGINGPGDTLPLHSGREVSTAVSRLQARGWR